MRFALILASLAPSAADYDVVIHAGLLQGNVWTKHARIFDVDRNASRGKIQDAVWFFGADLDPHTGKIFQTGSRYAKTLDVNGKWLHRFRNNHSMLGRQGLVDSIAHARIFDGERFVALGIGDPPGTAVSFATVWNATSFEPVCSCDMGNENVTSVSFDPSGQRVLTVSDRSVMVFDSACAQLFNISDRGNYSASRLSRTVGFAADRVAMLHTDAWWEVVPNDPDYFYYTDEWFHQVEGELTIHDLKTGQEVASRLVPNPVALYRKEGHSWDPDTMHFSLMMSADGNRLAVGYGGRAAQVLDTNGELVMDFSPKEADWNTWRLRSLDAVGRQALVDQRSCESCLGAAAVWDVATGVQTHEIPLHGSTLNSVGFLGNGTRILTRNGSARVWDLASGKQLAKIAGSAGKIHDFGTVPGASPPIPQPPTLVPSPEVVV